VHPQIVACADRGDHGVGAAGRLGIRIGIKRGLQNRRASSAGPPPDADALVRVGLSCHGVGKVGDTTRVERGRTAREPGVGEIEAPPPEVHGARLAEEAAPEPIEDPSDLDEHLPAGPCRSGVVGTMERVGFEANGVGDFDRHGPDPGGDIQPRERFHDQAIELSHRPRLERYRGVTAVRALDDELMRDEVERDRDDALVDRQRQRGEPAWRDLQGGVPVMVGERRQGERQFADDLRPQLQRDVRVPPPVEREWRPGVQRNAFNTRRRHRRDSSTTNARPAPPKRSPGAHWHGHASWRGGWVSCRSRAWRRIPDTF